MDSFFEKVKKQRKARVNPEKPYFYLALDLLRKKVDQKKRESQKTRPKLDYDRSLTKSFEVAQKRLDQGKVLHNSDNNRNNQSPLLSFVMNMVQN